MHDLCSWQENAISQTRLTLESSRFRMARREIVLSAFETWRVEPWVERDKYRKPRSKLREEVALHTDHPPAIAVAGQKGSDVRKH